MKNTFKRDNGFIFTSLLLSITLVVCKVAILGRKFLKNVFFSYTEKVRKRSMDHMFLVSYSEKGLSKGSYNTFKHVLKDLIFYTQYDHLLAFFYLNHFSQDNSIVYAS